MGANAAIKCYQVVNNSEKVIAIELMNAAQALEFRRPKTSSASIEELMNAYRKVVPFLKKDELLHDYMVLSRQFIRNYSF
jgi:histidine ammonia-lyase